MKRKKSLQRVLSAFLTILLLVSVVPTDVFAAGTGNHKTISDAARLAIGKKQLAPANGNSLGPIDRLCVPAQSSTTGGHDIHAPTSGRDLGYGR